MPQTPKPGPLLVASLISRSNVSPQLGRSPTDLPLNSPLDLPLNGWSEDSVRMFMKFVAKETGHPVSHVTSLADDTRRAPHRLPNTVCAVLVLLKANEKSKGWIKVYDPTVSVEDDENPEAEKDAPDEQWDVNEIFTGMPEAWYQGRGAFRWLFVKEGWTVGIRGKLEGRVFYGRRKNEIEQGQSKLAREAERCGRGQDEPKPGGEGGGKGRRMDDERIQGLEEGMQDWEGVGGAWVDVGKHAGTGERTEVNVVGVKGRGTERVDVKGKGKERKDDGRHEKGIEKGLEPSRRESGV